MLMVMNMNKPKVKVKHIGWICDVEFIDFKNKEVEVDLSEGNGDTSVYSFDEVTFIEFESLQKKLGDFEYKLSEHQDRYDEHTLVNMSNDGDTLEVYEMGILEGVYIGKIELIEELLKGDNCKN